MELISVSALPGNAITQPHKMAELSAKVLISGYANDIFLIKWISQCKRLRVIYRIWQVTNCTVHGDWTEWSEWSACSQSCGRDAVKTRKRTCTNPAPAFGGRVCVGQDNEYAVCIDNPPCPPPTPGSFYSKIMS